MTKDVTKAIAAKSDQLNADDLIGGPITIKVRDVDVKSTTEQPISVFYDGDDGKPWKPCKTAARCLAAIWGPNAAQWVGMRCTIYNDPTVTWAGAAVGGIRVSHMEGLDKPRQLNLAKTRGKKGIVTIQPLDASSVADGQDQDLTPILEAARAEAAKGKDALNAWWKANKQHHETVKPIMAELKVLTEKAIDDEIPM
jgi:hypothetical protein